VRSLVTNLQKDSNTKDDKYLKISACCKHFAGYSLEDWERGWIDTIFNAII